MSGIGTSKIFKLEPWLFVSESHSCCLPTLIKENNINTLVAFVDLSPSKTHKRQVSCISANEDDTKCLVLPTFEGRPQSGHLNLLLATFCRFIDDAFAVDDGKFSGRRCKEEPFHRIDASSCDDDDEDVVLYQGRSSRTKTTNTKSHPEPRVLIHCENDATLPLFIATACLMQTRQKDVGEIYRYVQSKVGWLFPFDKVLLRQLRMQTLRRENDSGLECVSWAVKREKGRRVKLSVKKRSNLVW